MTEQAMVEHFATLATTRFADLLKMKARHIYETTPGAAGSKLVVDGKEVEFRLYKTSQPYKDIERFMADDKIIGFVVNPGILSIVKAIATDVRGKTMLVTRRIADRSDDCGFSAHLDHIGIRIHMRFDSDLSETNIVWECLYAVA